MTRQASDSLSATAHDGTLAGLKVVDCSRVLGGPFCTQWLGDHGAEVIKIEPPAGDETRAWGPPFIDGEAAYFLGVNRSKRGIVLDLSSEAGQAVLFRLLAEADVLVENFKPGTLEKWDIGHARLQQDFPRLVHCRISGFGADGPLGGLPGYDAVVQAQAGLMSVNGQTGGEPTRLGIPIVDLATGLSAAFGIMAALHERTRSGKGQFVEASLYDVGCALLHPYSANYLASGRVPKPTGNPHPNICPYDVFRCGGRQIYIAAGNDGQFRRLCTVLGQPELADDPRYRSNAERLGHSAALKTSLEALLDGHEAEDICRRLMAAGVPAGPVNTIAEVFAHPHTRHRDMLVEIGNYRAAGAPVKFSRTPARINRTPPAHGQDTRAVLAELGYSDAQIEAMLAAGTAVAAGN